MKRRRLIALVSVTVLVALGLLFVGFLTLGTRTEFGRERIRDYVEGMIGPRVKGRVDLGRVSGSFLTGIVIDTMAVYDERGELVLSTGRVQADWDPRDIIDRRIYVRRMEVEHPYLHLRQFEDGSWNYNRIMKTRVPTGPGRTGPGFGDFVVLDSVTMRDARVIVSQRWRPDDSLSGRRRDSAIAYNLRRTDRRVVRTHEGFARTYEWRNGYARLSHVRVKESGDGREGQLFRIDTLNVDELDPPFRFRNVRGEVRRVADSLWLDLPHFDLPGSTGSAVGTVVWGSGLPNRYDIRVRSDSVSLADVNWVYPTLPTTGGGRMSLHIKTRPEQLRVVDYRISQMDVRSTGSHLTGEMTFGVGNAVLELRNVNLVAEPVDFELIRALNGKEFPVDWRGQLVGRVRARGGPLNAFVIDEARGEFRDAHVRGAVTRFTARGGLDILFPAFTKFRGLYVETPGLDLRTVEYLFPVFPKLGGTLAGAATLDSSWLDVRFRDADFTHRNGPGEPSRVIGSGRVTWGEPYLTYDADIDAQPLSLDMMARAFPALTMRGTLRGPIRLQGQTPALSITTSLTGPAGALSFEGVVDADSVNGYGARGTGQFTGLDLAALLTREATPATRLTGRYTVDLAGESAASLVGSARLALEPSVIDSLRFSRSTASVRFAEGVVRIDTLTAESVLGTLIASGGLGLPAGRGDSLRFTFTLDSLGSLRRYLTAAGSRSDSLVGSITLAGVARGRFDSLTVSGDVTGTALGVRSTRVQRLGGRFDFTDLFTSPSGTIALRADSVEAGGILLDTLGVRATIVDSARALFTIGGARGDHVTLATHGEWARMGITQLLRLDSAAVVMGEERWRLDGPAQLRLDSTAVAIDTMALVNGRGGLIAVRGAIPSAAPADVTLTARGVPLEDLSRLLALETPVRGAFDATARLTGTRELPVVALDGAIARFGVGATTIDRVTTTARFADRRLDVGLGVTHQGATMLRADAMLPMELSLAGGGGARLLDEPMTGTIRADSADFALAGALVPGIRDVSGRVRMAMTLGGTPTAPTLGGQAELVDAAMFVDTLKTALAGMRAVVRLDGDTVRIDARTGSADNPRAEMTLGGSVAIDSLLTGGKLVVPTFFDIALAARQFPVIQRRTLASLTVSTTEPLRLRGPLERTVLTGGVVVDRGEIRLPDSKLASKTLLTVEDLLGEWEQGANRAAREPGLGSRLVENMSIQGVTVGLGDDVRLKSAEADIRLAGTLRVVGVPAGRRASGQSAYRLSLDGELTAERGTYTLFLGAAGRRRFEVESGRITFDGSPDNNPLLDIRARHDVRRFGEADLSVVVEVQGRLLPNPELRLTSDEGYAISQSDLVSYLLIGRPGFDFSQDPGAQRVVAAFVAPTLSSYLSERLGTLGGLFDAFQFEGAAPASDQDYRILGEGSLQFLYGGRLRWDWQLGRDLILGASAGLCSLDPQIASEQSRLRLLTEGLAGRLEYRLPNRLSKVQLAMEPSTQALLCSSSTVTGLRGFAPTPQQFSLSFLRTWRF